MRFILLFMSDNVDAQPDGKFLDLGRDGILTIISIIVTILLALIGYLVKKARNNNELKILQNSQKELYRNMSILIECEGDKKVNFSREQLTEGQYKNIGDSRYCLILGEPACGKSFYMIEKFHSEKSKFCLFFDSNELIKYINNDGSCQDKLIGKLREVKKKYLFFMDGIDELEIQYGQDSLRKVLEFIKNINENVQSVSYVLSARKNYYEKNNRFALCTKYGVVFSEMEINTWTQDDLISYGKSLAVSTDKCSSIEMNSYLDRMDDGTRYKISNPLEMQMLIYLSTKEEKFETIREISTRYELYDMFLRTVFNGVVNHSSINLYDEYLKKAFALYVNRRDISFGTNQYSIPIFKTNGNVIHYSFFEFAISRLFFEKLQGKIDESLNFSLFAQEYKNEIADYISEAISPLSDSEKNAIIINLMQMYSFTMTKEKRKLLKNIDKQFVSDNWKIGKQIEKLSYMEFLTLKSQIIFRLGRIYFNYNKFYDKVKDVLSLIYSEDSNVLAGKNIPESIKNEKKYYEVLIKRGCAISASFLGHEIIEIDYVNHMLEYKNTYDYLYDLANRSHTMLFYGDISDQYSLFEFKDECIRPCRNSIEKRINRIQMQLVSDYPKDDIRMNKKYYFRLFDLATIYSFVASRRGGEVLNDNEKAIINGCFIDFKNASAERKELMQEIKKELIIIM